MEELAQIVADPMTAHQKVNANLAPLRQLNFKLADDAEMQAISDAQYLHDKAPKDPGNQRRLGVSTWRPSDAEVNKWANYFRALDPAGVWERAVHGRLTPQEAEALRDIRPETYATLQNQLIENLPQIQKNCSYDQQNRLTILTGVPVSTLCTKHSVDFIQQSFAERAGPDSKPVDLNANALQSEPPTATQKLTA